MTPIIEVIQPVLQVIEVTQPQKPTIVEIDAGRQGVAGPAGKDAVPSELIEQIYIKLKITNPISGHRVICTDSAGVPINCDAATVSHANMAIGISVGAATELGDEIAIQRAGMLVEPSWDFRVGPVYIGINGSLTQTLDGCSFIQQIGVAITPTSVIVGLQPALVLSEE